MFQDPRLALVLALLVAVVVWGGHRLGVSRRAPVVVWIWLTLVFLIWLLAGFHSVRAA